MLLSLATGSLVSLPLLETQSFLVDSEGSPQLAMSAESNSRMISHSKPVIVPGLGPANDIL